MSQNRQASTPKIAQPKKLEVCIDCGDPVTKPSPILNRICKCRDDISG